MKARLAVLVGGSMLVLACSAFAQPGARRFSDGPEPVGAPLPPLPPKSSGPPGVDPAKVQDLPSSRDYHPPQGIAFKATDFTSENVRLTAQWFYAAENEGKKLPTVIIAHGWGGAAANFRQDAVDLARAGYLVMLFDYRGWGDSDGRVMLTGQRPAAGAASTAEVRELRGYVDPWEQTEDWFNAISYASTNAMVDADRIGIRGSDLSGGYVIYLAAHDPRIKALVSQVSYLDTRPIKPYQLDPARTIADANAAASRIAAGQEPYPADRANVVDKLIGAPVGNKVVRWAPIEQAARVTAPSLFVLAEKDELFSNTNNGLLACDRVKGPRKMVMVPSITHYDIYGAAREFAVTVAIDWFDKYLKPAGAPTRIPVNRTEPERDFCAPEAPPPKGEELVVESGGAPPSPDASGRFN